MEIISVVELARVIAHTDTVIFSINSIAATVPIAPKSLRARYLPLLMLAASADKPPES